LRNTESVATIEDMAASLRSGAKTTLRVSSERLYEMLDSDGAAKFTGQGRVKPA